MVELIFFSIKKKQKVIVFHPKLLCGNSNPPVLDFFVTIKQSALYYLHKDKDKSLT